MCRVLLCFFLFFKVSFSELENVHKRHEYLFTFKGPILSPPGTNEIPFFNIGGHVIAGQDRVRLTTSLPNQQGWIWSKNSTSFDGFQIDLVFRITGNGRVGSDGLALWVVKSKSFGGPALGASAIWQGLGILFDTYDTKGEGRNSVVLGIINDGTKVYSPETDGKDISVGHCVRDFRNKPYSTKSRITYFNKVLVLSMSPGLSKDQDEMEECFRVNVDIGKTEYYIGLSSSTGEFADDHDVEKLEVFSLREMKDVKEEDEKKRLEEQKKYEEEYQHKMENIAKTEPVEDKHKDNLENRGVNQNLIAIWHEIAGQHEATKIMIKSIRMIQDGMIAEKNGAVSQQFDLMRKDISEVKNSVESVSRKMENTGNVFQDQQAFSQIHNSVDEIKSDIMKMFQKINYIEQTVNYIKDNAGKKEKEQDCGSCLSLPLIILIGTLQSALIIGFMIYQKNKDSAAKKFY